MEDGEEPTEEMIDETEKIIAQFTEKMWSLYDDDNNGLLEKHQAIRFLDDIFRESVGDLENVEITNDDLEALFEDLDVDKSGAISKEEFRRLIRESTGL